MTILRMYYTPEGANRPTRYREAWWEEDTGEFILHHGKVGEPGTTTVENVASHSEAEALLASFAEQNTHDDYVDINDLDQESCRVLIQYKGLAPTRVERTNAEKFAMEYTALLAWRGLGLVEAWDVASAKASFAFDVLTVHFHKAQKYAHEALRKTDFRADRMKIERN